MKKRKSQLEKLVAEARKSPAAALELAVVKYMESTHCGHVMYGVVAITRVTSTGSYDSEVTIKLTGDPKRVSA